MTSGVSGGAFTRYSRRRRVTNRVALIVCAGALALSAVPLIWILIYVVLQGLPAISLEFLTSLPTPVGIPGGGIANAIVGSVMTVGLGIALAAPVGVLAGLFVAARSSRRSAGVIRFATDTVAGVPSIVMGIVAYGLIVQPQGHFSAFSGGVVLSFIMLPIVIRTTEEMVRLVPPSLREASLALGAPGWTTSLKVIIPAAASGILTGLMLAIARGAGEAAPMLFTAFGNPFMSTAWDQPVATLPQTIYTYAISPYKDWREKAWAAALVLIVVVLVLNLTARSFVAWRKRRSGTV